MLLTLDLGTHLGWSLGPMDAAAPASAVTFGTIKLRETADLGVHLRSGDAPLQDLFARGVTDWVVESPTTGGSSVHNAVIKLSAQLGHVAYWGTCCGLRSPTLYRASDGKLRITGNGHAGKPEMIAAVQTLGYDVETEHEADAIALRHVHLFGRAKTKAQREKDAAAARRRAKAEAKAGKLL